MINLPKFIHQLFCFTSIAFCINSQSTKMFSAKPIFAPIHLTFLQLKFFYCALHNHSHSSYYLVICINQSEMLPSPCVHGMFVYASPPLSPLFNLFRHSISVLVHYRETPLQDTPELRTPSIMRT